MAKLLRRVSIGPTFIVPLSVFSLQLRSSHVPFQSSSFTNEKFVLAVSHHFRSRPFASVPWVLSWKLHPLQEDASIGPGSILGVIIMFLLHEDNGPAYPPLHRLYSPSSLSLVRWHPRRLGYNFDKRTCW